MKNSLEIPARKSGKGTPIILPESLQEYFAWQAKRAAKLADNGMRLLQKKKAALEKIAAAFIIAAIAFGAWGHEQVKPQIADKADKADAPSMRGHHDRDPDIVPAYFYLDPDRGRYSHSLILTNLSFDEPVRWIDTTLWSKVLVTDLAGDAGLLVVVDDPTATIFIFEVMDDGHLRQTMQYLVETTDTHTATATWDEFHIKKAYIFIESPDRGRKFNVRMYREGWDY